jgi:FdrA protein
VYAKRSRLPRARPTPRLRAFNKSKGAPVETDKLLQAEIRVINIGLREFATDLRACGVPVVHVSWSPPAVSDPKIAELLAKLGG